ncbi:MAG: hypothetical protein AB8B47_07010 [Roseobacter sp.]
MEQDSEAARKVSRELLEITGEALKNNDFEAFFACMLLPQKIETYDGHRMLHTKADAQEIFSAVRAYLKRSGITEMVRHCVTAAFRDADTIEAVHETRMVNGNVMTQAPFPVFSVLKYNGTRWQIARSSYAISDSKRHNDALMGTSPTGDETPSNVQF